MNALSNRRLSLPFVSFSMVFALCAISTLLRTDAASAEDWPTYQHDNMRTGVTSEKLGTPLYPQWTFEPAHAPEPAWPIPNREKSRVRFDECYAVAVAEGSVFFGSSADGKLHALDAETGQQKWSAWTNGPIRVAPTVAHDRVYVGSDDGFAYSFNASDGSLVWKRRAGFREDKLLGNGKMISRWPVRTGVLVEGDVAYFGAGVFPAEALFLYAVNAHTGDVIWCNDTYGEEGYTLEFGGVTPEGPMLVSETTLFLAAGRAMPVAFDKKTGAYLNFLSPNGKFGGTWAMIAQDELLAGTDTKQTYDLENRQPRRGAAYAWFPGLHLAVREGRAYMATYDELIALDRAKFSDAEAKRAEIEKTIKPLAERYQAARQGVRRGEIDASEAVKQEMASLETQIAALEKEKDAVTASVRLWGRPSTYSKALIMAGDTLIMGGENRVAAARTDTGEEVWSAPVEGNACGLAVAGKQLYVSTDRGAIACFGEEKSAGVRFELGAAPVFTCDKEASERIAVSARALIEKIGVKRGYALVAGLGTGRLAYELAKQTDLKVVGIDTSAERVECARAELDSACLYGTRVSFDVVPAGRLPYADYFADVIVSETALTGGSIEWPQAELERVLKPCGGVMALAAAGSGATNPVPKVSAPRGPLEGAGAWTQQYADPGNTATAQDKLVRGQLEVLWFGDPGPERMVERHARPAAPVSMDGRMFIQGEDVILAYDAYNGTKLWEREIPGAVRVRVDSDMGNLTLAADGLYVAAKDAAHRLDPKTGETVRTYALPSEGGTPKRWGYIAYADGLLVGSTAQPLSEYGALWSLAVSEDGTWNDPSKYVDMENLEADDRAYLEMFRKEFDKPNEQAFWRAQQAGFLWRTMTNFPAWDSVQTPQGAVTKRIMASDGLFALDPESGKMLWEHKGTAIAHPAIAIGEGLALFADCSATEEQKLQAMRERAERIAKGVWEKEDIEYRPEDADVRVVTALDMKTGEKRWERVIDLTGCGGDRMGLAYQDGVLCFFGCFSNHDRNFFKEGTLAWRRVTAVSAKDGSDLWSRPLNYLRRPVIVNDEILIEPRSCDLRTGEIKRRLHPLTGGDSEWEYVRPGHCCSATSAAPHMFFLRGYFLWNYDLDRDQGMLPFGAVRPGCWINVVPANGLLLFPEASSGCTCSYPVRSTVVLHPVKDQHTFSLCVQNGPVTPVQRVGINFGAPGDWRDDAGNMWFGYPHAPSTRWYDYGVNFDLQEQFGSAKNYFRRNFRGLALEGDDRPWLYASGAEDLKRIEVPLLEEKDGEGNYTVRLFFAEPGHAKPGERVFDVKLQGDTAIKRLDIAQESGVSKALVKEFKGVKVKKGLLVEFEPAQGATAGPILNGLEAVRE